MVYDHVRQTTTMVFYQLLYSLVVSTASDVKHSHWSSIIYSA